MKNYPSLGSGTKYYEKLETYVTEKGLTFDPKDEITIEDFFKKVDEPILKVADCNFCDRDNVPIKLKKNGEPSGLQKEIISDPDHEGHLVVYNGVHEDWDDDSAEWLYCITFDGHIVKIGMTITSLKKRYGSYICGVRRSMKKGTCSTTNFVVNEINYAALLQGYDVEIFGIRVPEKKDTENRFGITKEISNSRVRDLEEMLTDAFIETTGHIPVLCVQKGDSTS